MSEYPILPSEGVVPPAKCAGKYPWRTLGVNESFLVNGRNFDKWCATAANASRRTGRKFSVRSVHDQPKTYRIYRVR